MVSITAQQQIVNAAAPNTACLVATAAPCRCAQTPSFRTGGGEYRQKVGVCFFMHLFFRDIASMFFFPRHGDEHRRRDIVIFISRSFQVIIHFSFSLEHALRQPVPADSTQKDIIVSIRRDAITAV